MRIKQLFKTVKGHYRGYLLLFLLSFIVNVSYTYVPLFTQYILRALTIHMNPSQQVNPVNLPHFILEFFESADTIAYQILYVASIFLIWQLARFSLLFLERRTRGVVQESIAKDLRVTLYDHIQNLSYSYHKNVDTGDLIQRVTSDVERITGFVVMKIMELFSIVIGVAFSAYQMYFINPTMMWLCLSIIPFYIIASIVYFIKVEKLFETVEEKESAMMTVIKENVEATKVVKAFANEQFEIDKMEEKNKDFTKINIKAMTVVSYFWSIMDFVSLFQYLGIILLGVYYATQNLLDAASIAAALMLIGNMIWPVRGLGRLINDYGKTLVASDRIRQILDNPVEYTEDGQLTPEVKGHIEFKNVSFKFDDTNDYLLKDISFEINPKETVAFVGKTGSGKTTIINLLMRMYSYEGSIKIDGIELKDISKKHIRRNIGAVLQDPFLFSKTVYQNIAITNKQASLDTVKKAATMAALEKDIHTFKQGYETKVGEKGTTLSGGQKQRVAIARVLLSNQPILILDDALSALDNQTDSMVRSALLKREHKSTNLIITHRITTAKEADKIIVINDNKIEAIGTHKELSKQEGLYKTLWDIQGKIEKEFLELLAKEVN